MNKARGIHEKIKQTVTSDVVEAVEQFVDDVLYERMQNNYKATGEMCCKFTSKDIKPYGMNEPHLIKSALGKLGFGVSYSVVQVPERTIKYLVCIPPQGE